MEQEKEEHQQTKERGLVILTGVGHVGRQAILAHMLMEKMNHHIDIILCDVDEVPFIRIQENPQDLFLFVDVCNTTNIITPLPVNLEDIQKGIQDKTLTYEDILESFNKCFDVNKTARERMLEIAYLPKHSEDLISIISEQRKRRKDFVHIINDDGLLENSLLRMKAIVETFFKIPAPVP